MLYNFFLHTQTPERPSLSKFLLTDEYSSLSAMSKILFWSPLLPSGLSGCLYFN